MGIIDSVLDQTRYKLAKSKAFVHFAVKLRNQLNLVIGRYLGENTDHRSNGEETLIRLVAPHCTSFVDVGANIGSWATLFRSHASKGCIGLLFDPGNNAATKLIERFGKDDGLTIIQKAVGSEIGSIDFFEEPEAGERSSVFKDFSSSTASLIHADMTTLDAELAAQGWDQVDYLKIDAEGFDYPVMSGAKNLLSHHKISFIQFEYNSPWASANATLAGAFTFLQQHGYLCYIVRSGGLFELNYPFYKEYFYYSNFFAVAPEHKDSVSSLIRGRI